MAVCLWGPGPVTLHQSAVGTAAITAGLPPNNNTLLCSNTTGSCYGYYSSPTAFTSQRLACQGRGGYLVAYNSPAEQLEVELYFWNVTKVMTATTNYYIGLEPAGAGWYLLDGSYAGNGFPNNGATGTYAHW